MQRNNESVWAEDTQRFHCAEESLSAIGPGGTIRWVEVEESHP